MVQNRQKINSIPTLSIVYIFLLTFIPLYSQKKIQVKITDENINQFEHWNQLGSTQSLPNNKNYVLRIIKKLDKYQQYDSTSLVKLVDSLASLKSNESFFFLTDLCCRYIDYSRKNKFTRMAWVLNYYGGPKALNKYYLHDSIPDNPDPNTYHAMVYYAMREKYESMMNQSYYWIKSSEIPIPPTLPELVLKQLDRHPNCDSAFKIDDRNINEIGDPYQFLFIHEKPQNKLDSLIKLLIYDKTRDSTYIVGLIDQIGAIKSPESYCFLYNTACRFIVIHDMNLFNYLTSTINYYGAHTILNKYYLNNQVSDTLSPQEFKNAVFTLIRQKEPECYYCTYKTWEQLMTDKMSKINTKKTDIQISSIIAKNSDLKKFGGFEKYSVALDSILQQVLRLPEIDDAYYDYCDIKVATYPGTMTLGVIIQNDSIPIEKCYTIKIGKIKHSCLNNCIEDVLVHKRDWVYYNFGFINKERILCEDINEE